MHSCMPIPFLRSLSNEANGASINSNGLAAWHSFSHILKLTSFALLFEWWAMLLLLLLYLNCVRQIVPMVAGNAIYGLDYFVIGSFTTVTSLVTGAHFMCTDR